VFFDKDSCRDFYAHECFFEFFQAGFFDVAEVAVFIQFCFCDLFLFLVDVVNNECFVAEEDDFSEVFSVFDSDLCFFEFSSSFSLNVFDEVFDDFVCVFFYVVDFVFCEFFVVIVFFAFFDVFYESEIFFGDDACAYEFLFEHFCEVCVFDSFFAFEAEHVSDDCDNGFVMVDDAFFFFEYFNLFEELLESFEVFF